MPVQLMDNLHLSMEISMSSIQYLKVTSEWNDLITTTDAPQFVKNSTGAPMTFFISSNTVSDPDSVTNTFTLGGSIGVVTIPAASHFYIKAAAISESVDPIVVTSTNIKEIKGTGSTSTTTETLDSLYVEVMKLSNRVTDDEIKSLNRYKRHWALFRAFVDYCMHNDTRHAALEESVTGAMARIFSGELWMAQHTKDFIKLQARVDEIYKTKTKDIDALVIELNSLISQAGTLAVELTELKDDVDAAIKSQTSGLTNRVEAVADDLDDLSNAITKLSTLTTAEEIQAATDTMIAGLDSDTSEALKSAIRGLATIVSKLSTRVDYNDTVVGTLALTNLE